MTNKRTFWTKDKCKEVALKYYTTKDWQKYNQASYKSALNNGWLNECRSHMISLRKGLPPRYTIDDCITIAKSFPSREAWKKKHPASYKCACLQNWYYECVRDIPKLKGRWNTLEKCQQEALNFKTISEWRRNSPSSYAYAYKKGWIKPCSLHMEHKTRQYSIEKDILRKVQLFFNTASSKRFKVTDSRFYAKYFEIDIYIPEIKKGIEFDGKYWHSFSSLRKRFPNWPDVAITNYHNIKDSFFLTQDIQVLHIKEEDWLINKEKELDRLFSFIRPGLKEV